MATDARAAALSIAHWHTTLPDVRALQSLPANKLLASLPPEAHQRILAHVSTVALRARQVLYKQGEPIRDVYFLSGGVCSVVKIMEDGAMAQIAAIGNEGMLGSSVWLGDATSLSETIVQIASADALKMPADMFIREMDRREAFYNRVTRYSDALMAQVIQTTACNGLHFVDQRCCRYLLMTRDRVGSDDLKLTHEALAVMLGVRRPSITLALGELQKAAIIESGRGVIRIIDRARLEQASCECYAAVKSAFRRILPEIAEPPG